ncbi:MAG: ATP synthase F0 subunit C [Bdellovibrionales bacterium]
MRKLTMMMITIFGALPAFAEEVATTAGHSGNTGMIALAAGLAIGIAACGGALGQGKIGASAMDGIARNPQAAKAMFVPMIVGLALVESLVIYALVIAFMLQGKV